MDPIETNNETLMEYVKILKEVVSEIDDSIRFHDVRLVVGETHKNLIFDLLVSFEFKYTDEELIDLVKTKIREKDPIINCVIQIDKDYTIISKSVIICDCIAKTPRSYGIFNIFNSL